MSETNPNLGTVELAPDLEELVVYTMSTETAGRGRAASSCCCFACCCCCSGGSVKED